MYGLSREMRSDYDLVRPPRSTVDEVMCVCICSGCVGLRVPDHRESAHTMAPSIQGEGETRGVKQRYKPKAKPRPRPAGIEYSVPRAVL